MAKLEKELKTDFNSLIDECNDAVALLGQANKQINLARKDFLRPELSREYSHLCHHSRPVTNMLFGDDVSKSAKEIEDVSKISNRMFSNRHERGGFQGRRRPRSRFRGGRVGPRGRDLRNYYQQPRDDSFGYQYLSAGSNIPKNLNQRGRRGSRPQY